MALVTYISIILHVPRHATIHIDKPQSIPDPILDLDNIGAVCASKFFGDLEANGLHAPIHHLGGYGLSARGNNGHFSFLVTEEISGNRDGFVIG